MLHTKFSANRPTGSGDSRRVFTIYIYIYGHGGHLGHVTSIMLINFHFHVPKSLHKKLVKMAKWFLRKAIFNFHM